MSYLATGAPSETDEKWAAAASRVTVVLGVVAIGTFFFRAWRKR